MGGLVMLLAVVGVAGATGSCREHLMTAASGPGVLAAVNVQNPCTEVRFRITGGTSVEGSMPPVPCPASPVALAPGGAMEWLYQEHPHGSLKVKLRVRNQDTTAVGWPRLVLAPAGRIVGDPAGADPALLLPVEADSIRQDGSAVWLLQPDGGGSAPELMAAGVATASRMVQFRISAPAVEGVFAFSVVWEGMQDTTGFPAVAPDSQPAWFRHDSSWTADGVRKRILWVEFHAASTTAERKAAIDSIGGRVVGGVADAPGPQGSYFIEIPGAETRESLYSLIDVLTRQSVVSWVSLLTRVQRGSLRPSDGPGWQRGDWNLSALAAGGENWALEAIAAPMAWGCSTGLPGTVVGVVDASFLPDEFSGNLVNSLQLGRLPGEDTLLVPHGTVVSNLLAAYGNDGHGMSGVMWRAGLQVFESPSQDDISHLVRGIVRTALSGATIVNLSVESDTAATLQDALEWRSAISRTLDGLSARSIPPPLIVTIAGNHRSDAQMAGLPGAALDYPRNVLVVGGVGMPTTTGAPLMTGSGVGPLVHVFAPAVNVGFRSDSTDPPLTETGTSFAAPFVSGIAGLLKSFDPSLTAEEIRDLIVQGAAEGNIPVDGDPGKYVANAYESLKLAAGRPKAPLCGNRVWTVVSGGMNKVYAERNGFDEVIYERPATDTLSLVIPAHGGRTIYAEAWSSGNPTTALRLTWNSNTWTAATLPRLDDSDWSGTTWSFFGWTHDGDSLAYPPGARFGGPAASGPGSFTVGL